jgi:hypothetical protein
VKSLPLFFKNSYAQTFPHHFIDIFIQINKSAISEVNHEKSEVMIESSSSLTLISPLDLHETALDQNTFDFEGP